jgi:exodeoxyribonuclease VII large subunit
MDLFSSLDDTADVARRPLSVSELTAGLRSIVEGAFTSVLVEGEISNCRQWSSGHLYFTLKDSNAQIRAVMFRTTVRLLRFTPEDGMHVVARGRLSVYEAKGEYQIVCDSIEPHGLGARQAAFETLKKTLQGEGLFDSARKRPLPILPRRIGVVTSLDGAAIRDIVRVLTQRFPGVRVLARGARVQGEGAADDIARALRAVAKAPEVDVVIIGRGGGSAEDLWAFNDEGLARAIAACPVPVISAVGHEVDFTIADFVADVRAATPSNAAEIVVDRADSFFGRIDRASRRLRAVVALTLARRSQALVRADARLGRWPTGVVLRGRDLADQASKLERAMSVRLARHIQRLDRARRRLESRDLRRVTRDLGSRLQLVDRRLRESARGRYVSAASRLTALSSRLDALSPLAVLGRGFAVCWNESHDGIIRSAGQVRAGDTVHVTLHEGEMTCRVSETRSDPRTT